MDSRDVCQRLGKEATISTYQLSDPDRLYAAAAALESSNELTMESQREREEEEEEEEETALM